MNIAFATLNHLLDEILQSPKSRLHAAQDVLDKLAEGSAISLACHLIDAEFGKALVCSPFPSSPPYLQLTNPLSEASARAVISKDDASSAIVRFSDIDICLKVLDEQFYKQIRRRLTVSAASTLAALQFCRDHIDDLLYLPAEMRTANLSKESVGLRVSTQFLTALAISYNHTQHKLAGID